MAREKDRARGGGRASGKRAERSRSSKAETTGQSPREEGRTASTSSGRGDTFFARATTRAQERRGASSARGAELRGESRLSDPQRGAPGPLSREAGHGGYGATLGGGALERGGLVEPGGYREDVGYRGGAADMSRGSWSGTRQSWPPGWSGAEPAPRRSRWQREPVLAAEIMTREVRAVRPDASLQEVAIIMRDENTGVVPVVSDSGRLQGLITDRDIVMRTLPAGNNPLALRVADVMTEDVEAVTPDESVREVVDLMGDRQIRRVPVVDADDRLVGIISIADVATRADFDEDLQDALEEISARRSFWSRVFG